MEPLHISKDGARWRVLARNAAYEAGLVYYSSGIAHGRHEHASAQATFLLTGGFAEQADGGDGEPSGLVHGFKPAGARHACRFGRDGALILSVNFRRGVDPGLAFRAFTPSDAEMGRVTRLLFDGCLDPVDAIDDLLGGMGGTASHTRDAPGWLRRVAERFADEPLVEVSAVAADHGIHRVQLSRAFQRHLGVSPSRYRLHCKAARAVRLMLEEGEAPSMAAAGAGFADQAHLTRTVRTLSGMAPARLRGLLAA